MTSGQDTDIDRDRDSSRAMAHGHRAVAAGGETPGSHRVSSVAADAHRRGSEWRRLDRRMLLIKPLEAVKDFLPYILIALFAGASRNDGPWWTNLAVVAVPILIGVWSWATTRYRITRDQLSLRRGILQRTTLTASLDRVRTVDVTASLLQRLLGVASVKVGTGSERPFGLDGLAAADATALRDELLHVVGGTRVGTGEVGPAPVTVDGEETLGVFSPTWLRYAPFSLTGLLAVLALVGFLAQFTDELVDRVVESDAGHAVVEYVLGLSVAAMVVQGLTLAIGVLVVSALVTYLLRYWGYRLTRHPRGTLAVTRGLLTTRSTTIEERRLRGVSISRPFLLRLVGAASAEALVTGLTDAGESTTTSSDLLVPPAPRAEVLRIGAEVLRDEAPLIVALRRHGPAARRRRYVRAVVAFGVLAVAAGAGIRTLDLPWWTWLVPVLFLAVSPAVGEARYRSLGHALTPAHLVSRAGVFPEETTVVRTSAIIGWNVVETPFQRRVGLVTLVATIAAGDDRVDIPDIRLADAEALVRAATPGLAEQFMRPAPTSRGDGPQIQERNHMRRLQSS